jgi:2-keto-4-pentenoate hydratase
MTIINQIVDTGRIIREGDIILSGAIGAVQPSRAGKYTADYGELGTIEFRLAEVVDSHP